MQLTKYVNRASELLAFLFKACEHLSRNTSVIVDMTSRHVTVALQSFTEEFGILHVTSVEPTFLRASSAKGRHDLTLNFVPPEVVAMESVRAIVEQANMTSVAIIYDETFSKMLRNFEMASNLT